MITVYQYKKYVEYMSKNNSGTKSDAIFYLIKIVQDIFENKVNFTEIQTTNVIEFLTVGKTVHFVMQDLISQKFAELIGNQIDDDEEGSCFDNYDQDNGYIEIDDQRNIWEICKDNIDRIIKIAIRLMRNSYTDCLKEDIWCLLDYLQYEIATLNE